MKSLMLYFMNHKTSREGERNIFILRLLAISTLLFIVVGIMHSTHAATKTFMMPKVTASKWLPDPNYDYSRRLQFTASASAVSWNPPATMLNGGTYLWLRPCDKNANYKTCRENFLQYSTVCASGVNATCVKEFNNKLAGTHILEGTTISSQSESCLMVYALSIHSSVSEVIGSTCEPGIDIPEPPPVTAWCGIGTSSVTINFGTLTSIEAPGKSKSENIFVTCEGAPRYYFKLQSGNAISLSNGMTATITVDGYPLGTQLTGVAGMSSHSVTATLGGVPNTTGAFSGTGVLLATYP